MKPTRSISLPQLSEKQLSELMLLRQYAIEATELSSENILTCCLNYKTLAEELNAQLHISYAYHLLGQYNLKLKNYPQAIDYLKYAIQKGASLNEQFILESNVSLAKCFENTNDIRQAIEVYTQVFSFEWNATDKIICRKLVILHYQIKQSKTATNYLQILFEKTNLTQDDKSAWNEYLHLLINLIEILIAQKRLVQAEELIVDVEQISKKNSLATYQLLSHYYLTNILFLRKQYTEAFNLLSKAYEKRQTILEIEYEYKILLLLAELSDKLNTVQLAFDFFERALHIARQLHSSLMLQGLNSYYSFLESREEYEMAYQVLKELQEKEEAIDEQLKNEELKRARTVFENREQEIRLENLTAVNELNKELQVKTEELKIKNLKLESIKKELMDGQLLRSQMNPHFIYNSLNSISSLIRTEDNEKADKYLLKFSKLTRDIFNNSTKEKVLLSTEIRIVKDYLDMELLRFKNRFKYYIKIDKHLTIEKINIPPMILQPIAENAIKHGVFHLDEEIEGRVELNLAQDLHPITQQKVLRIEIKDNGVGLKQNQNFLETKMKQSALFITIKRLHNFNKTDSQVKNLFYEEQLPHGSKFILYIKI